MDVDRIDGFNVLAAVKADELGSAKYLYQFYSRSLLRLPDDELSTYGLQRISADDPKIIEPGANQSAS